MILCHKCSGLLASGDDEDVSGLLGCQYMSGYVRGFEVPVDRSQAILKQIAQQEQWIALYRRQEREPQWIERIEEKIAKLKELA